MLTADLVRASVKKGVVVPRYVDAGDERLQAEAEALMEAFRAHVGQPIGALEEAIADLIGDSTDYLRQRGLAKLLMDRARVETVAPRPPSEVRAVVFRHAGALWPVGPPGVAGLHDRGAALAAAAAELGLTVQAVEDALYADLKAEQRLVEVDLPPARTLLERYNLALAQAVLLRARQAVVTLEGADPKRVRQLFRIIKFHRLMHRAERTEGGVRLTLDGPLSLFRQTQRYGLQMALVLPSLAHAERWRLEAEVAWGDQKREASFVVSSEDGLASEAPDLGTWESDEEKHLRATFGALDTLWQLRRGTRIVDLKGRGVLVPDYTLHHRDGRVALLEIVWFWRLQGFKDKLALVRKHGPGNLIVAVATRMNVDERDTTLDEPAVYPFKGVIQPKKLIALAEEVGRKD